MDGVEWSGVDTPQTVMTTRAPAVLIKMITKYFRTHTCRQVKNQGKFYEMVSRMENIQNIIHVVLSIQVENMIWRDHNFKYGLYSAKGEEDFENCVKSL